MRDVKSLAAEIEAVTIEVLAEAIRRQVVLLRFNEARTLDDSFDADEIELLCIRAANAVKDHVTGHLRVEAPANQSRAFEDGARTVALPAGWVAVPRYPTAAMLIAAGRSVGSCDIAHEAYAQAIAAAPALAPNSTEGRSDRA